MSLETYNSQNSGLSVDVGDELSKNLTIHKNVKQEVIITTADKIRFVLYNTQKHLISQREWYSPCGLFISVITTLGTSNFKATLGFEKELWHAIFFILAIISFIWLVYALIQLYNNWGKVNPSEIINRTVEYRKIHLNVALRIYKTYLMV